MIRAFTHASSGVFLSLICTSAVVAQPIGPDVIVGDLPNASYYGTVGTIHAYSVGTTSCNIGDMDLLWIAGTNEHPVIGQNMYRLKNGRFEQIGMSWLKHGFTAVNNGICGTCNGHLGSVLGVGCSDPYGSGLNGTQSGLGPRYEVNPYTGVFAYPFATQGLTGNAIYKRIQVQQDDIDPALNAGALFFVEGHYVTQDDAAWGNGTNNASYRRCTINANWTLSLQGTTNREWPAIKAWELNNTGVTLTAVDIPNEGRIWTASRVTDLGGGVYHYEYAIQNINSDRAVGGFSVPIPAGATVTNAGFKDINYHSGEPFSGTDWSINIGATSINWGTESYGADVNANALRWGTLYNFWFDVDAAPVQSDAALHLFKPTAGPGVVLAALEVPAAPDCNGNGTPDAQDIANAASVDCNANDVPDECELAAHDCDGNGVPDDCDAFVDCNSNGIIDACEADCDTNGVPDSCEASGPDCNNNGIPDHCDAAANDCDTNGVPDECQSDCDGNGVIDACEGGQDCNTNGTADSCDLVFLPLGVYDDVPAVHGFVDVSSTGTSMILGDDSEANATMPFTPIGSIFTSSQVRVCNNGGIAFGLTSGDLDWQNQSIPSNAVLLPVPGEQAILAWWDDLYTGGSVHRHTIGVAPNRTFIVQWTNRNHFNYTAGGISFQIQVFETPVNGTCAQIIYTDTVFGTSSLDNAASASIGYQLNGTDGIQWSYNTAGAVTSGTVLSVRNPPPPSADDNGNGIPDECESVACATCAGDLDGNGVRDGDDLQAYVAGFMGGYDPCVDMNGDLQHTSADIDLFVDVLINGPAGCP